MSFPTQIQHVIVIAFENRGYQTVMNDPYWASIANTYAIATNYTDVCHLWLSLPSYMATTSGTTKWNGVECCGTDSPPGGWWSNNSENIFDLVNKANLTYTGYAEADSGTYSPCSTTNITDRHFPPVFYSSVHSDTTNGNCVSKVRPFTDWQNNILNGNQIPANFVWITPNICNDGHDCAFAASTNWLQNIFKFDTIVTKPWFQNTAIFLWYDDSAGSGGNGIYLAVASPISKGLKSSKSYNHYNALSTFEWLLGLPSTGNNDSTAAPMTDLFTTGPAPLSVSLSIIPKIIDVGQNTTLTATAIGGMVPYTYSWNGLPGGCIGGNINTITCKPATTGTFNISVSVTDSSP